ncbi:MFS transporter [Streptomyces albus]|uniref:MFS transporter n=1 Tax=Streptomyces albus TaxID=1888 RepID=UPI0006E1B875|nr:MFS transporter [Streptomyces albus]
MSALRWAAALGNADWHLCAPLLVALAAAWHTDIATVTTGVAAYSLGQGLALPLWGWLADRYGPGCSLRTGLVVAAAASVGSALCPGPGWWVALRTAAGAGFATVTPSVSLYFETLRPAPARQRAFAALTTVTAASALASLAAMLLLPHAVDTTRLYEGTDTRAAALLLGSLAATAPVRHALGRLHGRAADLACGALVCGLAAYWAVTDGEHSPSLFTGGLFLHALAAAALIALLAGSPDGHAGRILGAAPPRRLGELSYSLYLWHWPLYVLLPPETLGFGGWPRAVALIGLSLLAAALSTYLLENPVRHRASWTTGRTGALVLAAALAATAVLWTLLPRPPLGAGSVDISQLAVGAREVAAGPALPGHCAPA